MFGNTETAWGWAAKALHRLAGALYHLWLKRDGGMQRMLPERFSRRTQA